MADMIAMNSFDIAKPQVVILAAGFSTRLGQPKALARIRGVSLLRRTLALLTPFSAGPPVVVVPSRAAQRYRQGFLRSEAVWVCNSRRALGLSTSVRAGIRAARYAAAVLILPVDLPALTAGDVARLVASWRRHRRQIVARRSGGRALTPLIVPRRWLPDAGGITGEGGLREWVAGLPAQQRILVELCSAKFDVDTRADLAAARRRFILPHTIPH